MERKRQYTFAITTRFRYTYLPDAHKHTIQGSFGVYGPGAFVQYMQTHDRDSAVAGMEELEVRSGLCAC